MTKNETVAQYYVENSVFCALILPEVEATRYDIGLMSQ